MAAANIHSRRNPASFPFGGQNPTTLNGPVLDLRGTIGALGLKSRQMFRQSGLDRKIRSYQIGRIRVYDAAAVGEWARRLARLRLAQKAGELHQRYPLAKAPAGDEQDANCPHCGAFARRGSNGEIWCLKGHHTPSPV
jgi:hypothetical protein